MLAATPRPPLPSTRGCTAPIGACGDLPRRPLSMSSTACWRATVRTARRSTMSAAASRVGTVTCSRSSWWIPTATSATSTAPASSSPTSWSTTSRRCSWSADMDRRAWVRDTLSPKDWLVTLPAEAVEELDAVVHRLRREPFPILLLSPTQFELSHCREVMAAVGRELRDGIGLAVLDRVPVERYSEEENRALAWLLGSLLGRLVAQKWDGLMIYDVRDTGRALSYGVRRSVTNLDLVFHTDAAWLELPPELVGLYCINPAREGGVSRFVSLVSVHNEMARRHPTLLARLYRPLPWDRQAEHAPADAKVARRPVFQYDGRAFMACVN